MAVSYGVGAALTLDEFALWLSLSPDVYWTREGRLSIDAIVIFGAALAVGAWGAPFFGALQRLWQRERPVRMGIGQISSPLRRGRSLRRRKVRRSPPHISQ
jgi:hypothetical protein